MKQIPIFQVTGIFLVLVFLCSVLFGCGGTGSAADDAYLTQVTASVTEAQSLIDEMISFSNEMTEATGTFSENKDSDAYVEQCRTKLTLLEEKVAVVQELQQQIEKSGAPSSDFGKAIEQEQKEYFEDMLLYLNAMQETLTFYTEPSNFWKQQIPHRAVFSSTLVICIPRRSASRKICLPFRHRPIFPRSGRIT